MNIETQIGCLLISLAWLGIFLLCHYCGIVAIEKAQKEKLRRDLAKRFQISARVTRENTPGAWRNEGAGAKNERGAW